MTEVVGLLIHVVMHHAGSGGGGDLRCGYF